MFGSIGGTPRDAPGHLRQVDGQTGPSSGRAPLAGVVVFWEEMGIRTMENHGKIMDKNWENHDKTSDMSDMM